MQGDFMTRDTDYVTIVSGLPRSGTSMMMRMLEAGGVPPLVDNLRKANADNPKGYFEFEPVKALKDDSTWVAGARGMAVKIIYKLVYDLPMDVNYRIIFMQRDVAEVVASQEKMLVRDGLDPGTEMREMMIEMFQGEVLAFRKWAQAQHNIEIHYADYAQIVTDPRAMIAHVAEFLDHGVDIDAMAGVVDPALYRNRA